MDKKVTTGYSVKGFIEFLEAEKLRIDNAITSLKALSTNLNMSNMTATPHVNNSKGNISDIKSDTFYGKGFIEAVLIYLGMVGEKQTTETVLRTVRSGGIKIGDASAQTLLTARARKKKDLVRVGRGEWGLMEWYDK